MYTEAIVSQNTGNVNTIQSSTQTTSSYERYIGSKHVWPTSGRKRDSGDLNKKQRDLNLKLERLKCNIETRLRVLLNNTSYKSILKDVELVNIESFKEFLKKAEIPDDTRRDLELCLFILIFIEKNKKLGKNATEVEYINNNTHKYDICGEVVNQIVNFKGFVDKIFDTSLDLLVNVCIWTVETTQVTNLVQLCFELLLNILRSGFRSGVVSLFIKNGILDKSSIISLISYTEAQYQQIYWKIRILQVAVSKGMIVGDDIKYVREFAINSTKLRNKSIYILDESVCLLAQVWLIERLEFDIDFPTKLRVLSKLLTVGDHTFLENFSLSLLTKISILGPIDERKLCLKCISLIPDKVDREDIIKNIESLLYKNNFRKYKELLPKMDLGILTVGLRFLKDLDTSLSYLDRLHNLINNIIYWSINNDTYNNNKIINTQINIINKNNKYKYNKNINEEKDYNAKNINKNKNDKSRSLYKDYIVMLKILSNNKICGINNKKYIKNKINKIKTNLKNYYYSIFELVNAVIATRSYISCINSMAINIDYTYDLSLYLLLSMDVNYTSICRDYIKALTISTNHVDFNFIEYIMDIIRMSSGLENNNDFWIFRILLSGICNYFEILFEYSVKDIYGSNHQRINQLCEEIIRLFKYLIGIKDKYKDKNKDKNKENNKNYKGKRIFRDYSLIVQIVKVMKVMYVYNESIYEGIIEIIIKIIKEIDNENNKNRNKDKIIEKKERKEGEDNKNKDNKNKEDKEYKDKNKRISKNKNRRVRYNERIDGYRGELMETLSELYENISIQKVPYRIQEYMVMIMIYQQCTGYVVRGLYNSLIYNSNKRLVQLVANQLRILQVQDWDTGVYYSLRKLVSLVLVKLRRLNCKMIINNRENKDKQENRRIKEKDNNRGDRNKIKDKEYRKENEYKGVVEFKDYKFKINKDSVNKILRKLIKIDLVNIKQVNELKLFNKDYSISVDVVQSFTHDCPGE